MPGLHTSTGTPRVALAAPYRGQPIDDGPTTKADRFCNKPGTNRLIMPRHHARFFRWADIFSGMGNPPGCLLRSPGAALPEQQTAEFFPPVQPPSHYCGSCPQKNPRH